MAGKPNDKVTKTIIERYGRDHWRRAGRLGGLKKGPKGFATMSHDKVSAAGRRGGLISRRNKAREDARK